MLHSSLETDLVVDYVYSKSRSSQVPEAVLDLLDLNCVERDEGSLTASILPQILLKPTDPIRRSFRALPTVCLTSIQRIAVC